MNRTTAYIAMLVLLLGAISFSTAQPAPPRDLHAVFHDNIVSLFWRSPESDTAPSFYRIYRNTGMHVPGLLATTTDTTYNDSSVGLNQWYAYFTTAVYPDSAHSFPSNGAFVFTGSDSLHDTSFVKIWFTSQPVRLASVGKPYEYDPTDSTSPPGVAVCFHLDDAPDGMTIDDSTGKITWTPTHAGIFEVELVARACNGGEGEAEQEFNIFVLNGSPGSVAGTVQNDSGRGLGDVKVKLFDVSQGDFVMRTFTDSSGHYNFPVVNPSTYYVRAKPEEDGIYAPQWYNGASDISSATPVVVPESTAVTVNFTLHRIDTVRHMFTISGTVMDTASNPIGGAKVLLFRLGRDMHAGDLWDDGHIDLDPTQKTFSDSNGHYSFTAFSGTFIVGAFADGYKPQFWDHRATPLVADHLVLSQDTSGIDFNLQQKLPRPGSITGTIFNAADSSGLKSHVIAFLRDTSGHFADFVAVTRSDSTGNYVLDRLPVGSYLVLGYAGENFVPTFYSSTGGTPFLDSATSVNVTAVPVAGINIYLPPDSVDGLNAIGGDVAAISGGSTTLPVGGALITIKDGAGHVVGSSVSQNDGTYLAPGFAPGTYSVVFQKPGLSSASVPVSLAYVNSTPSTVTANAQMAGGGSGAFGTMNVRASWNMISLPVTVSDAHASALFPSASSSAFGFTNNGYQAASMLDYGAAYWIKFPAAGSFNMAGTQRTTQTIPVVAGWNMIGTLSTSVSTASATTAPPGIVTSSFYGYDGGYAIASSLDPSKGYWVKTSSAGTLSMAAGASTPKTDAGAVLSRLNSLTIRDAAGNSQTLYFGSTTDAVDLKTFELPPAGPADAFDVRFASSRIAEIHSAILSARKEFPIALQSVSAPLSVSWEIKNPAADYSLMDAEGQSLARGPLTGKGSIRLAGSGISRLVLGVQGRSLPTQFALHQNYPNPFNPSTRISFDLPTAAMVSLNVFNILGQHVATLYNNEAMDAGQHAVKFDASSLGSGIYFYRLQAGPSAGGQSGNFVSVKKMMLVK